MQRKALPIVLTALWFMTGIQPASADKLVLTYLPPDFPPSDICVAEPEDLAPDELREVERAEQEPGTLDNAERLQFLTRDIRSLTDAGADRWFDFILGLLTWQAELDPGFAGIEEAFARVDLYLSAGREDELRERGVIDGITLRSNDLSNGQRVRLARFYLSGIGVDEDRARAEGLLITAAYAGNAEALMEILRLQVLGENIADWDLPAEKNAELAFGGLIGQLNMGLCNRAERMAREYIDGDILVPNPDLAYAWRKFAADMGGAEAAWRVVEYQLGATGVVKDNDELLRYLQLAVANGYVIEPDTVTQIVDSGATTESDIRSLLGFNYNRVGNSHRRSAVPLLELEVKVTSEIQAEDGEYLRYLREIAARSDAPAPVLLNLANEILLRRGRWKGEAEVMPLLEQAVALDDPDAMSMLAGMLLRYQNDRALTNRAEALLIDAVSRHGHADAMNDLSGLYRCRLPASPLLQEAEFWSASYRAADIAPVTVSATDVAKYDVSIEPEAIARLQTLGLRGHGGSTADMLQFLQSDPLASDLAMQFWADRVSRSDQALEEYAKQEFELALTSDEAQSAIELFRRTYLDNGATSALDLAVVLVKHAGRDPEVAQEIRDLLQLASSRGEGSAIRLLKRLEGADGAVIFQRFAQFIADRGDFLAFMFAAPYVDDPTFDDYMGRAIAVMNCNTKDAAELADAYTTRNRPQDAAHWLRVGLAMEGGHTLSKLGISDWQMADFDLGLPIPLNETKARSLSSSNSDALRREYVQTSDPGYPGFDPETAAAQLIELIGREEQPGFGWALAQYRQADRRVQDKVQLGFNMPTVFETAANAGDSAVQYELGMLLRRDAKGDEDLRTSADWLEMAANAGHTDAMVEYGYALGLGAGLKADPKLALIWLQKANGLGNRRARDLITLFTAMTEE